jgi:Bestrophin, RFP-TM, chloride channel
LFSFAGWDGRSLRWFMPLGSTLVGFMFLAVDRIGRNLENPFDNTIYDLPVTAIDQNHLNQSSSDPGRIGTTGTDSTRRRDFMVANAACRPEGF